MRLHPETRINSERLGLGKTLRVTVPTHPIVPVVALAGSFRPRPGAECPSNTAAPEVVVCTATVVDALLFASADHLPVRLGCDLLTHGCGLFPCRRPLLLRVWILLRRERSSLAKCSRRD